MSITVECPSCSTSFPVDPAKIPEAGVNARCSQCSSVFRVERPPAEPEPAEVADVAAPEAASVPAEAQDGGSVMFASDDLPPPEAAQQEPEAPAAEAPAAEAPVAEEAAAEAPAADAAAAQPVQAFTFGKRDPTEKARRLARVLVSDMIMYNPERHEKALADGTLEDDFEDEIAKSWREYVEQVGEEMAEGPGRGFWADALNDVLAKGQQVF